MPVLDGLQLQAQLNLRSSLPLVFMSGQCSVGEAAQAFRAGAIDFLTKPIDASLLILTLEKALDENRKREATASQANEKASKIGALTERELSVATRVAEGKANGAIATDLGIALRTVKLYRQRAMEKLGVTTLPDLVRVMDGWMRPASDVYGSVRVGVGEPSFLSM